MRVVFKAKARHHPAPHLGILLVNHKGNSSTLTNRLLGTTPGMVLVSRPWHLAQTVQNWLAEILEAVLGCMMCARKALYKNITIIARL